MNLNSPSLLLLCDYSDTGSSDTEPDPSTSTNSSLSRSPRKRKTTDSVLPADTPTIFPRDFEGNVDLFNPNFSWEDSLISKLESIKSDCGDEEDREIDGSSWESRVVVKRRFYHDEDEDNDDDDDDKDDNEEEEEEESNRVKDVHREESNRVESEFKKPKQKCRKFMFQPFKREKNGTLSRDESQPRVEVIIPEQLAASYGLYVWPSSPVLSWYIWLHQEEFKGKRVLELGSGTSLPGLLSAKIGCSHVTLTDEGSNVLDNIRDAVRINELDNHLVDVRELSWGLFYDKLYHFEKCLDYVIGSDLFFDPAVFQDLVCTVSWLLETNPNSKFICAVQERSQDWSIEEYLVQFDLRADYIRPNQFLEGIINEVDLIGGHTIYIMILTKSD